MLSYLVSSPAYPRVHLRLVCYMPSAMLDRGLWKCVLQVVERGKPLAEHPIEEHWFNAVERNQWIEEQKTDGWTFEPDGYKAKDHQQNEAIRR